jgi:hypothetical protein
LLISVKSDGRFNFSLPKRAMIMIRFYLIEPHEIPNEPPKILSETREIPSEPYEFLTEPRATLSETPETPAKTHETSYKLPI